MITIYLKHPQVAAFAIGEKEITGLRKALPGETIHWCRSREEFLAALPETEAALVWYFREEWYPLAPRLKLIATPAAGKDLLGSTPPEGIRLLNGRFHGEIMAETTLGMVLSCCRGLMDAETRRREPWPRGAVGNRMTTLRGARITLLGMGAIGTAIAEKLLPFGPVITGIRKRPPSAAHPVPGFLKPPHRVTTMENLTAVLKTTDHLIITLPRNPETDDVIGAPELELMPPTACLYNLGRGNAIDEEALIHALRAHQENPDQGITRAWLDVFQEEPLPEESPLRDLMNCHLLPHASAIAPDYMSFFIQEVIPELLSLHRHPK